MIIGNQEQQQLLRKIVFSYDRGAFLLIGPEGVGKFSLIKKIAKEYVGENENLIIIDSEEKIIKLMTAKFLQNLLRLSTNHKRIIIVNDAHKFNKEAQNSLLKTIEEIMAKALLFFVSHKPFRIYPTIRSRMQIIKFNLVPQQEIEAYLDFQQADESLKQLALDLFPGQPGKIFKFLEAKEISASLLQIYSNPNLFEKLLLAMKLESKIDLENFLAYLIILERKKLLQGDKNSLFRLKVLEAIYYDSTYFLNKSLQLNNIIVNIL